MPSALIPPFLVASLFIFALALHILARRESSAARSIRGKNGIPQGEVVYSDLDRPGRTLFSKRYGIAGKPDYIIKDAAGNCHIPVEVKSGQAKRPYGNHVLQLAAYCLLVEENYNKTLRSDLLRTVQEMRRSLRVSPLSREPLLPEYRSSEHRFADRGNDLIERCRFCSLRAECQRIRLNGAIDGPKV